MRVGIAAPSIGTKEIEYVSDAVRSTWVSSKGKYVKEFEKKFADYIGVDHALSVCNGTVALHLATMVCANPGDEVIIPATTMIACPNVVKYCGAEPVFVDIEEGTCCIDPYSIIESITKDTVAIMPVHLYGHPAEMNVIRSTAEDYGLRVIEDCAEAHGAEYRGKKVGSLGDIGCFSFYGNKIITTGEGGMVTTNDNQLAEKMDKLRNQGYNKERRKWLEHDIIGYNYRLTNVQCALGLAQLERIDEFIEIHRSNAMRYNKGLGGLPGIITPCEAEWAKSVYWMYTLLLGPDATISRDMMMERLGEYGIDTRAVFPPLYTHPPYRDKSNNWCQFSEFVGNRGLNLPSGNTTTPEEVDYVIECIKELLEE